MPFSYDVACGQPGEDEALEKRVARQAVGAVHAVAARLARGVQVLHLRAGPVVEAADGGDLAQAVAHGVGVLAQRLGGGVGVGVGVGVIVITLYISSPSSPTSTSCFVIGSGSFSMIPFALSIGVLCVFPVALSGTHEPSMLKRS